MPPRSVETTKADDPSSKIGRSCDSTGYGTDRITRTRGRALMQVNFKKSSLLILAITAVVCSRTMFAFFDDPEGPNLLVVTVMAAVIYLVSSAFHLSSLYPSLTGFKRTLATIFIQIFVATSFYLVLR
jgi:hypothetical protein